MAMALCKLCFVTLENSEIGLVMPWPVLLHSLTPDRKEEKRERKDKAVRRNY